MKIENVIDFYGECIENNLEYFATMVSNSASYAEHCDDEMDRQKIIMEDVMEAFEKVCENHDDWHIYESHFSNELDNYKLNMMKKYTTEYPAVQESIQTIIEEGF